LNVEDEEEPAGLAVRCRGVEHRYRTDDGDVVTALHDVDLDIAAGERAALLGPSGSGKSTLLRLVGGVQRPSAGHIWLGEADITRMTEPELALLRSSSSSSVLQGAKRNLLPYATALGNVRFARSAVRTHRPRLTIDEKRLLADVGLDGQAHRRASKLSGGQQQRLALACAVVSRPKLLLADEPTSQLSHEDRDGVLALLHRVAVDYGMTVLVITHDPTVAASFPRNLRLRDGCLIDTAHISSEAITEPGDAVSAQLDR
jgi:ABC-type lipoprotein export system ATPase subunit